MTDSDRDAAEAYLKAAKWCIDSALSLAQGSGQGDLRSALYDASDEIYEAQRVLRDA